MSFQVARLAIPRCAAVWVHHKDVKGNHPLGWHPRRPDFAFIGIGAEVIRLRSYLGILVTNRIYRPRVALAPWIYRYECFDSGAPVPRDLTAESHNPAIAVLPDIWPVMGFQYCGRIAALSGQKEHLLETAGITGLQSSLRRYLYAPRTGTLMVRFYPWGASAFLPMPMHEISDRNVGLVDLLRQTQVKEMQERLDACAAKVSGSPPFDNTEVEAEADLRRIEVIESFLTSCLTSRTPDGLIRRAIRLMQKQALNDSSSALAEITGAMGIGERQLERKFKEWVGFGPKKFARLLRFRQALERLNRSPRDKVNVLASGFYDPSHLHKEIKAFTGLTPQALAGLADQAQIRHMPSS